MKETNTGTVIAVYGQHYLVKCNEKKIRCIIQRKKNNAVVGDSVQFKYISSNQAIIETINQRSTLLYRSNQYQTKFLAANITQLFIVVATEPNFSDDLVSRALVAAESIGITAFTILNKSDIKNNLQNIRQRLQIYAKLGYPILEVSALTAPDETRTLLIPLLKNRSTIFIGQSGMGKSSIIKLIIPDANIVTQEISTSLHTGKHTTTLIRLYSFANDSIVIDSPGFHKFGLYQLNENVLKQAFREFAPYLGHCRFYNCHHLTEPGCALLAAVKNKHIASIRHVLYSKLLYESSQKLSSKNI